MAYDYKSAFDVIPYTREELQQIALTALMQYKMDTGDDEVIEVDVNNKNFVVTITGKQIREYYFKDLGFAVHQ